VIEIVAARNGLNLSVENVNKRNPVICVGSNGDPFRSHGQMWELEAHLLKLASPLRLLAAQADQD